MTQLHVDAAAVLLFNPRTELLEYAAGQGFQSSSFSRLAVPLSDSYPGQVVSARQTICLAEIDQAEAYCGRLALLKEEGFVSYYGVPLIARGQVKGVLELFHRTPINRDTEWFDFMGTLAGQASIAIDNANMVTQLQETNLELTLAYDATIAGWARVLELRDRETEGHCRRVTDLTMKLARRLGLSEESLVHIRRGAILHDIGKMAIPDHILLKAGPLNEEEYALMQQHPVYAYHMLSAIPFLRPALDIPYCHHEKWDGSGYPSGLHGEMIPFAARMFAVVDVWDALRYDRPYRQGWPKERVRDHIRQLAGTHFDPQIVEVFLALIDEDTTGL